jgi:hypothetical protein
MISQSYRFSGIDINIHFTGEYFINREGEYSHTSPVHSIERFNKYVYE